MSETYNLVPDTSRTLNSYINESYFNVNILDENGNSILQIELDADEINSGMTVKDLKDKIMFLE